VILWVDAQLSPALAPWITDEFGIEAYSVNYLGLRDAEDPQIFRAAREAGAVVLTKDNDFVLLLQQHGPPPQVLWVTLGNTSNTRMKQVLRELLHPALELLGRGEPLVEISEPHS
jgi:predicted nuclease of predicted toxin-antitoxin system